MSRGMENVAQGIKLDVKYEAFGKIQESTSSSSDGASDCAGNPESGPSNQDCRGAIQRIALNVRQMARSATDQASNTREIRDGTRRMNALTETVATAGATKHKVLSLSSTRSTKSRRWLFKYRVHRNGEASGNDSRSCSTDL